MQRVQRKFGTFLKRSDDEADVGNILKEFEETDRFLAMFISHGESFLQAWRSVVRNQLSFAETLHALYEQIGTDEDTVHTPAVTPKGNLVKISRFESVYAEVNADLAEDLISIEDRLLKPAIRAHDDLKSLKKVIKKREDRKLDYERYLSRVESSRRKEIRSEKEEASLMRHESDLSRATLEYNSADEHIKRSFPPFLNAVSKLLPHLLTIQVMIQHSLVGQLYTAVYGYCQQQGMPLPAPPLEDVVSVWDRDFTPLRNELESGIMTIASGKAVHQPMELQDKQQGSVTGLGLRTAFAERRQGSQGSHGSHGSLPRPSLPTFLSRKDRTQVVEDEEAPPPKPARPTTGHASHSYGYDRGEEEEAPPPKPARPTMGHVTHSYGYNGEDEEAAPEKPRRPGSATPSKYGLHTPNGLTPVSLSPGASSYLTPEASSYITSRASPGNDGYIKERRPSTASSISAASIAAAKKKKPPPPVPTKRIGSGQSQYVVAVYDFPGQSEGDLSFVEGDKIRVIKKTESTDDWWKGEIRGVIGNFPANYVNV